MAFTFKADKTIQAVAALLKREHGCRTNYMRLLKLLYIADRESIAETGQPITGDRVVAMARGPVLSSVLHLIKSEHAESASWDQAIRKDGYDIELLNDPGNGCLSRYEVKKLHEISTRYVQFDEWAMVRVTHRFIEWKKNKPAPKKQKPIPIEEILDAVGRTADKDAILREASYASAMDRLFQGKSAACDNATPS